MNRQKAYVVEPGYEAYDMSKVSLELLTPDGTIIKDDDDCDEIYLEENAPIKKENSNRGRAIRRVRSARARRQTKSRLREVGFLNPDKEWWKKRYMPIYHFGYQDREIIRKRLYRKLDQDVKKMYVGGGTRSWWDELDPQIEVDEGEVYRESFGECMDAFVSAPEEFLVQLYKHAPLDVCEFFVNINELVATAANILIEKKKKLN